MLRVVTVIFLMFLCMLPCRAHTRADILALEYGYCPGDDPTLTAEIIVFTQAAKKQYTTQVAVMDLLSGGHIWNEEEFKAIYNLQYEFNQYLDSFRSILCYIGQIYGFYHEITMFVSVFNEFGKVVKDSPSNTLAVLLSKKKNSIYTDCILTAVDIVNDIRSVLESKSKMTERERVETVLNIRPKLKVLNKKLQHLTRAVKYTSLNDVWYELTHQSRPGADKEAIVSDAHKRWSNIGKNVKPK